MALLADALMHVFSAEHCGEALRWSGALSGRSSSTLRRLELGLDVIMRVSVCCCRCLADRSQPGFGRLGLLIEALLYVHRNRRFIRDGAGRLGHLALTFVAVGSTEEAPWRVATWVPALVSVRPALQPALMIYQLSIGRPRTPFV